MSNGDQQQSMRIKNNQRRSATISDDQQHQRQSATFNNDQRQSTTSQRLKLSSCWGSTRNNQSLDKKQSRNSQTTIRDLSGLDGDRELLRDCETN